MQHQVCSARTQHTLAQFEGYQIGSSFGALSEFAASHWVSSLVLHHNDPKDEYHFDLFRPFVIGRDIQARHDIVHINISSP